jgi:hypothetical protein
MPNRPTGAVTHTGGLSEGDLSHKRWKFAGQLLATVAFSIIAPIVTNATVVKDKLSGSDQVLIGLAASTLLVLIQLTFILNEELELLRSEQQDWRPLSDDEAKLVTLRSHLHSLKSGGHELFFSMLSREVSSLERRAEGVVHGGAYSLTGHDDDATAYMLRRYEEPTDDMLRMVHFIGDTDFLYDVHARDYFRDVYQLVQVGHIKEVRRLMIFENPEDLRRYRTKLLASFHEHSRGYDYRLLDQKHYGVVFAGLANLPSLPRDFGVYGSQFAYRTTGSSAADAIGVLTCSVGEIERMTTLFDKCWASMSGHKYDVHFPATEVDSLDKLFRGTRSPANSRTGWNL